MVLLNAIDLIAATGTVTIAVQIGSILSKCRPVRLRGVRILVWWRRWWFPDTWSATQILVSVIVSLEFIIGNFRASCRVVCVICAEIMNRSKMCLSKWTEEREKAISLTYTGIHANVKWIAIDG